jgi:hypothetical protein
LQQSSFFLPLPQEYFKDIIGIKQTNPFNIKFLKIGYKKLLGDEVEEIGSRYTNYSFLIK